MKSYKKIISSILLGLMLIGSITLINNLSINNASADSGKTELEWKETSRIPLECYLNDKDQARQDYRVIYTCSEKKGKDDQCTLGETKEEIITENNCSEKRAYCHATSAGEVNPYNYLFNTAWVEHIRNNGTPQAGHELDFFTWEGDKDCTGFIKVCTDPKAKNYDSQVDQNEIEDNSVCEYNGEPTVTPTPIPTGEPTVTPTPTSTPGTGGPGDGLSDGRSDGRSSCPECTQAPSGSVLGASTGPTKAVLGLSTTSAGGNIGIQILQLIGSLGLISTGALFYRKNA